MKRSLLLILMLAGVLSASSQEFTLTGKIENMQQGRVYLAYENSAGKRVHDSVNLQQGTFRFSGIIQEPVMAFFYGHFAGMPAEGNANQTMVFLEPGKMKITAAAGDFKSAQLRGSFTHREYDTLQQQVQKVIKRWAIVMDTLSAINKRSNVEFQETKAWALAPYNAEMKELNHNFIDSHPASYVTAYLLRYDRTFNTAELQARYDLLPDKVRKSGFGKTIAQELEKRKIGVPGAVAADFSRNDINGKMLSLSAYKGKYVLLDFWASWCVPCRKLNPHLKELYAKYKDQGLEVIGVSDDDRDTTAWRNAVSKDGLPWRQVLRGMKRNGDQIDRTNDLLDKYNVHSLPTHVLMGPDGIIVGRYGGDGEEHEVLDKKLETIFK